MSADEGRGLRRLAPYLLVAAGVVVLDQLTKELIAATIPLGSQVRLLGPLALHHLENPGLAFGFLAASAVWALVAAAAAALVAVLLLSARPGTAGVWGAGLLLGGGLSNLVDRLRLGAVVDFVQPGKWPAFNLADVAVVVGVALLAWSYRRPDRTR